MSKFCISCGNELSKQTSFCPMCGEKMETSPKCPSCNKDIAPDIAFCIHCGYALAAPTGPQSPKKFEPDRDSSEADHFRPSHPKVGAEGPIPPIASIPYLQNQATTAARKSAGSQVGKVISIIAVVAMVGAGLFYLLFLPFGNKNITERKAALPVEIQGASLAWDYSENPVIVVTYKWTNTTKEALAPAFSVSSSAFQKGVALDPAFTVDDDSYDSRTSMREVQPGTAVEVQAAFLLTDIDASVEFELKPWMDLAGDAPKVTEIFTRKTE